MRNFVLFLGAFVLGAVCMFCFTNHNLVLAQAPHGNAFTPVVPPPPRMIMDGNIIENGQTFYLDGMNVSDSIIRNSAVIVYGGGVYNLRKVAISGDVQIQLIGAAANTANFLTTFGMIGCPAKPQIPQVNPNTPFTKVASLDKELKGDFVSPYSGGQ